MYILLSKAVSVETTWIYGLPIDRASTLTFIQVKFATLSRCDIPDESVLKRSPPLLLIS